MEKRWLFQDLVDKKGTSPDRFYIGSGFFFASDLECHNYLEPIRQFLNRLLDKEDEETDEKVDCDSFMFDFSAGK